MANGSLIYFIEAVGVNLIKIGIADDPRRRLVELQTASPYELVLLATRDGTYGMEKIIHRKFAECRVLGEWFRATPRLRELVRRCCESSEGVVELPPVGFGGAMKCPP